MLSGASPKGGQDPRTFENRGGRPPINLNIAVSFFLKRIDYCIFQNCKIKEAEIRVETKFEGR